MVSPAKSTSVDPVRPGLPPAPEPSSRTWRVLPPNDPDANSARHRRLTEGYLGRIEAARAQGDREAEDILRTEYEAFLAASSAAWELAECLPVQAIVAGKRALERPEEQGQVRSLLALVGGFRSTSAEDYLVQAAGHLATGDPRGSLDRIDAGLTLEPDHLQLRCLRGQVQLALGYHQQAHAEYLHAVRLAPEDGLALSGLGKVLIAMGHGDAAIVPLRRALTNDRLNAELWHLAAEGLIAVGRLEDSLAYLRRGQSLDVGNESGALRLGLVLSKLGRHEEASAAYERHLLHSQASEGDAPQSPVPITLQVRPEAGSSHAAAGSTQGAKPKRRGRRRRRRPVLEREVVDHPRDPVPPAHQALGSELESLAALLPPELNPTGPAPAAAAASQPAPAATHRVITLRIPKLPKLPKLSQLPRLPGLVLDVPLAGVVAVGTLLVGALTGLILHL